MTELYSQLAAYGMLQVSGSPENLLFLPVPEEDLGKQEGYTSAGPLVRIVPGMLGIISGAVDPGEAQLDTIIREAIEERTLLLKPDQVHNSLPTLSIRQIRPQGTKLFEAHGFMITLDPLQKSQLEMNGPVIEIPTSGISRFLTEEQHRLRPAIYRLTLELVHSGRGYH